MWGVRSRWYSLSDMHPLRLILAILACLPAFAAVRYVQPKKLWVLETAHTNYVIGVNEQNAVQHVYWGARIVRDRDLATAHTAPAYAFESNEGMTSEEYPGWGGMRYAEPALKVTTAAGVRDLVLKYVAYEAGPDTLTIHTKDIQYDLAVDLVYRVYAQHDIVEKHTVIRNQTQEDVTVESAQSGVWYVPAGNQYRLSYLTGRWAGETQLVREPVQFGKKVIESRRGNTSHGFNPYFALDYLGRADEEHGRVWFGEIGWSGNWKIVVEQTAAQQVRVVGGYNDFDFGYRLKPGEALETPPFYGGYTEGGFGESSRILHRFQHAEILPGRTAPKPRPVLYNSWEATEFHVTEDGQKTLADRAARIGVELFVMDDGWFGARNNDKAGLGDWVVNKQKFPNGLKPLIDHVNGLGMKFGLWVEPEMVNPDSDLYRAHPDWAIHMQDRPRTEGRQQLNLNMARDDVKEYIFAMLDRLLAENHIEFIKWDMNRHFAEPGWPEAGAADQKKLWVKYVNNVYAIFDRLRARHPAVEIESCSGGGGRIDLGILRRVNQVWTSDNTEAFDRLTIQDGYSQAYTAKAMMAWVTDVPNMNGRTTSLKYRFLVAMMGSVGIGADLNKWKDEDFKLASEMVSTYKRIRSTVQQGRLYRLFSPREGNLTANQYVSEDGKQAVLFAFLHSQQFRHELPAVNLRGLDAEALYKVRTIDNKLVERIDVVSGSYLMNKGVTFRLGGDFDGTLIVLERQ
jgi:alpha-galactosidase